MAIETGLNWLLPVQCSEKLDDKPDSYKAFNISQNIVWYGKTDAVLRCARHHVSPASAKSLRDAIAHPRAICNLTYARHSELSNQLDDAAVKRA